MVSDDVQALTVTSAFFRILVLDKGQVVEFDSPANLMANPDAIFHDMVKKAGLLNKKQ